MAVLSHWTHEPQSGGVIVTVSDLPFIPARGLAKRLRDLREREYRQLTQRQLAEVLGGSEPLSTATISLWEKPGGDRLPPPQRLAAYARLFCTSRSFDGGDPRLLDDDELIEEERQREAELYDELLALRERAQAVGQPATIGQRNSIWRFPDGRAVSIVCSDAVEPPPYAQPSHLNFSHYARYADLDALVLVFGQVKSDNPGRMVRILPTDRLAQDFALNHLIIIGGAASGAASLFAQDIPLPAAEEIPGTDPVTHLFRCSIADETREFTSLRDDEGDLMQDVGLIARGPHPLIPGGTVTLLSGITSRGVHGAAQCFIESHLRETNEQYLQAAFGNVESFCILMNIPVQNNTALPPNLWRENTRLYEWSAETGARWGDRQDDV
jgi:transcriptional regulator with XRE-family HTH domain